MPAKIAKKKTVNTDKKKATNGKQSGKKKTPATSKSALKKSEVIAKKKKSSSTKETFRKSAVSKAVSDKNKVDKKPVKSATLPTKKAKPVTHSTEKTADKKESVSVEKKVKGEKKPEKSVLVKKTSSRKKAVESKKEEKLKQENEQKWEAFYKKAKGVKPTPFNISRQFQPVTPISHPVFGWGWIISNTNDRLEVIFKDKVRILLSNYNETKSGKRLR